MISALPDKVSLGGGATGCSQVLAGVESGGFPPVRISTLEDMKI